MSRVCVNCNGTGDEIDLIGGRFFGPHPCPACRGSGQIPGTALILHPDASTRDPYGLQSLDRLWDLRDYAEGVAEGWKIGIDLGFDLPEGCPYPVVRDCLLRWIDVPETTAQMIALWVTRAPEAWALSFPGVL